MSKSRSTRTWTIGILIGVLSLLIGWDIYVAVNDAKGDTISEIVLELSMLHVASLLGIVFALGVLTGHIVWPQFREKEDSSKR